MIERASEDLIESIRGRVVRGYVLKRVNNGEETEDEKIERYVNEIPTNFARSELLIAEEEVAEIKDKLGKLAACLIVSGKEVIDFDDSYLFEDFEDVSVLLTADKETLLVTNRNARRHEITTTFCDTETFSLEIGFISAGTQRIRQRYFSGERSITQMSDEESVIVLDHIRKAYIGLFGEVEK